MIESFEEVASGGHTVHCGFKVFTLHGKLYVQLDTDGSTQRKIPGKVSQSIQLDEAPAAHLADLLNQTFPNILKQDP